MPPVTISQNGTQRKSLRIAVIGQSAFAAEVFKRLEQDGHQVVGVFTVPDKDNREDALAEVAASKNRPVFKFKTWRIKGQVIPEVLEAYKSVNAELNVLPFCSQYIPTEVIDAPTYQSIIYHPSILPKHRGASAIAWTLIDGDKECGFSVFWADDGLDTGPILLQKRFPVAINDTADSLYKNYLYPEGINGMVEAVNLIASGTAPKITQSEIGASYDPALFKPETHKIDWTKDGLAVHNFIRALDSSPGATTVIKLQKTPEIQNGGSEKQNGDNYEEVEVKLFGSSIWDKEDVNGDSLIMPGLKKTATVHEDGLLITAHDGIRLNIQRLKLKGKMVHAKNLFKSSSSQIKLELTTQETEAVKTMRNIWQAILRRQVDDETDFFECGAGSMDVVRLVEEIKFETDIELANEDVYMNTTFDEFSKAAILKSRSAGEVAEVQFRGIEIESNKQKFRVPTQLFIGGAFVDSDWERKLTVINPTDETVICTVDSASVSDTDRAVKAAHKAFTDGEWTKISARERGLIMYRLADLMEKHKEELATLESLDSGAVYTLALKTHIGMSIESFRYFAGWCDKIQGTTIPVSHARPNRNLSLTKREPIGVCGVITPWNYPLMMLSWKLAACLAAGNTVVIKPAAVCPLTALKFAELSVLAGFPPGVINVLPGSGALAGQALSEHSLVRKLAFTGSTEIGQTIMSSCAASNMKKVSLELGGKSPLIIFDDCDMDKAVKFGMSSVFFNKGENCIAAGRLFVEKSIHDQFVARVCSELDKMVVGDPLHRSTSHGPQNHKAHLDKLVEYCERGVSEGARLIRGGKRLDRKGYFFEPTVFTDVKDNMYIAQEESFGPIMIISKFDASNIDDVIKRANATEFGLAGGVITTDMSRALTVAERLDAGTIFINTYNKTDVAAPFGGFKQSGFGKDLGQDALNEYLKTKCITIEY